MMSKNSINLPNFAKGKLVLKIEYKDRKKLQGEKMRINFDEQEKILTLKIEEEIDHHMAGNLRREADYEIQRRNPKRVILDFNNVVFMDSAGIGMVIGRYKFANMLGAKLEVSNLSQSVKRIFGMSGILKLIPVARRLTRSIERE